MLNSEKKSFVRENQRDSYPYINDFDQNQSDDEYNQSELYASSIKQPQNWWTYRNIESINLKVI